MLREVSNIPEELSYGPDNIVLDAKGQRLEVLVQPWCDEGVQYYVTREAAAELQMTSPRYSPRMPYIIEEDF